MAGFGEMFERYGPAAAGLWSELNNNRLIKQLGGTAQDVLQRSDPFGGERGQYAQMLSSMLNSPDGINNIPGYAGARDETIRRGSRAAAQRGTVGTGSMASDLAERMSIMDLEALQRQQQFLAGAAGAGMAPDTRSYSDLMRMQAEAQRNQGGSLMDGLTKTMDMLKKGRQISNMFGGGGGGNLSFPTNDMFGGFGELGSALGDFGLSLPSSGAFSSIAPFATDGLSLGGGMFSASSAPVSGGFSGFSNLGSFMGGGGSSAGGGFGSMFQNLGNNIGSMFGNFSKDLTGGLSSMFNSGSGLSSSFGGFGGMAGAAIPLGLIAASMALPSRNNRDAFGRPNPSPWDIPAYNREGTAGTWEVYGPDGTGGMGEMGSYGRTGIYGDTNVGSADVSRKFADTDFFRLPNEGRIGSDVYNEGGLIPGTFNDGIFTAANPGQQFNIDQAMRQSNPNQSEPR